MHAVSMHACEVHARAGLLPRAPHACLTPASHPHSNAQREHPDSVLAANLRACIEFRAGGPAAALASLGGLPQQLPAGHATGALVRHNAVVFSGGQGALQVGTGDRAGTPVRACWPPSSRAAPAAAPSLPLGSPSLPLLTPPSLANKSGAAAAGGRGARGAAEPGAGALPPWRARPRPGPAAGPGAGHCPGAHLQGGRGVQCGGEQGWSWSGRDVERQIDPARAACRSSPQPPLLPAARRWRPAGRRLRAARPGGRAGGGAARGAGVLPGCGAVAHGAGLGERRCMPCLQAGCLPPQLPVHTALPQPSTPASTRHPAQVPGRQCLASAALLGPRPEEAAPLLESVAEVVSVARVLLLVCRSAGS